MSCSCPDKKCNPCAYCLPPGVTNLPDCNPKDPCEKKYDSRCILFSGPTHICASITHGSNLQDILLFLLNQYSGNIC